MYFWGEGFVWGGDADGAGVEVALADIDAACGDEGDGAEVVFFSAEHGGDEDVAASFHASIGAKGDAAAEAVEEEDLLSFCNADFPRDAGEFDG